MTSRRRIKTGQLTSAEKRVVYMHQIIEALPNPLPKELVTAVRHMQEMVRHYNGHAATIQRLNEKIESQRKRLAEYQVVTFETKPLSDRVTRRYMTETD